MTNIDGLTDALIAARSGGAPVPPYEIDSAMAFTVQARVAARLGPVGGFKYASRPGAPAIMAPIQAAQVLPSGATFDSGGRPVAVELEVGFRLNAAPPPVDAADFEARLREIVTPVAAIELVQTRLDAEAVKDDMMKLADHQLNSGLVVGQAGVWDGSPLTEVTAHLQFDGETVLDGPITLPFGEAFTCLTGLARMVGDHCGGLKAGDVVITGSLNGLPWLNAPTQVQGRIAGIGEVAITLA